MTAADTVVSNVVVLVVVYLVVGYGLVPTTVWAARQTWRHLSQVAALLGRALPFVLLFSAFLFLNADLWQVAHDFTPLAFWVTVGLLVAVAALFIALRIPREIAQIARFESWGVVCNLADRADSPLAVHPPGVMEGRPDPPLSKADRINVALVVSFNLGFQVALVSAAIGLFYVLFGLLAVRADTIVAWTSLVEVGEREALLSLTLGGTELVLTAQLLRVAGFVAAFSALQFAVAAVTDSSYREEFFDEVTDEVKGVLAVRSVYLDRLGGAGPPV